MARVSIYLGELHTERLFVPGGDVYNWSVRIQQAVEFAVVRECPIGHRPNKTDGTSPGYLASTIFSERTPLSRRRFEITAGADAYYTQYVVKGTSRIQSKSARDIETGQFSELGESGGMRLPANPGYGGALWRRSVRGQQANNFIARGYNDVARRHAALPPMTE